VKVEGQVMGQYTGTEAKLLQGQANEKAGWERSTTQVWGPGQANEGRESLSQWQRGLLIKEVRTDCLWGELC
jgi:hypothetical protein